MEVIVARAEVNTAATQAHLASPVMSDLPGGRWAALLVGRHWPGSPALATVSAAAASRRAVSASFDGYADALRSVAGTVLSDQEGATATAVRKSFLDGAEHARGVAERNDAKQEALSQARRCASELRCALAEIAERGARQIDAIIAGTGSGSEKTAGILAVVSASHAEADTRTALCLGDVYGHIQTVLDSCGQQISARQFAHAQGVTPQTPHRMPASDLEYRVRNLLDLQ